MRIGPICRSMLIVGWLSFQACGPTRPEGGKNKDEAMHPMRRPQEIARWFDGHHGNPRLILFMSPT